MNVGVLVESFSNQRKVFFQETVLTKKNSPESEFLSIADKQVLPWFCCCGEVTIKKQVLGRTGNAAIIKELSIMHLFWAKQKSLF